jgi:signal transduction histidine kinase
MFSKPVKTNRLLLSLIIFAGAGLISCSNSDRRSPDDKRIDSSVKKLEAASYNNPDSALKEAKKLLAGIQPAAPGAKAKVLLLIAGSFSLKGEYDSSIATATQGLALSKSDAKVTAGLYNEIGVCYDYKSDYKNALTNYQLAEEYFRDAKDTVGYIKVRNNVGLIYQNTGELERAKKYFIECLQLSDQKGYANEQVMAMSNLASVENELHNFGTALEYFKKVLKEDLASGNEAFISYSYHNVGEAYKNLRKFDSAVLYFTRAISLKEKLKLHSALVNSYKGYADLLIEMNKVSEASFYLNKAFHLARETGTTDYLQDCFYLQSRLAEKKGDFKTAYASLDSFHTIKDSLSNAKFRSELIVKEKDHELAANEKIHQQETAEFKAEKTTFVIFIIFFAAVSGLLLYLLRKQKKLNKQLGLQKQQIEEGLAQRSHLLSFIAHEIRNPLGGIIGLTDLLLNDYPTSSQKELLEYQKRASSHLLSLMNDVLDYQKLGSGKVELNSIRFNLRDVLYQVYALYQNDIREKKLSYDLDYDNAIPPALLGDPIRLTQVFSNLLNNAVKFTEKGTVSISVRLINQTDTEATIFCKVTDSGIGIPKEDQELIFELYVQSSKNKSAQLGTGLGLSIVRNLLSLMNSSIELKSSPDEGTTFTFTITFRIAQ